mgnify:CR=1 FL=1
MTDEKSRRLNPPLPQRNQPLWISADLQESEVLIWIEPLLPSEIAHQKIPEGAEGCHPNRFSFEILWSA